MLIWMIISILLFAMHFDHQFLIITVFSTRCRIARGTLQQILQRFSTNSLSLIRFIEELDEFWGIHSLLNTILADLCLCAAPELTPFLELPHVKIGRAKKLFNFGYKTLEDIANEKPTVLRKNLDFKITPKSA